MPKSPDLVGKIFGKLTVINKLPSVNGRVRWECICECGEKIEVVTNRLLNGSVTSCGKHKISKPSKDITGQKFGVLTAIKPSSKVGHCYKWLFKCECGNVIEEFPHVIAKRKNNNLCQCHHVFRGKFNNLVNKRFGKLVAKAISGKDQYGNYLWKCDCMCGTENYIVKATDLVGGHVTSCGCKNHPNLIGQKFGKLTVIEKLGKDDAGAIIWKCMCDCGNTHNVVTHLLLSGGVRSCGCLATELLIKRNKERAKSIRVYPQWFIDELVNEEDKIKALNGSLMTEDAVQFNCDKHGVYTQNVRDHIVLSTKSRRSGCPKCANITVCEGSKEELNIKHFITSLCNVEGQKIRNLGGKEIDLYYPDYNIGIEYNGSIFHATLNAKFVDKDKLYHQQKFLLAKEQGIHLINIFDVDWENNKEKIKTYLSSLFLPKRKIFARKCELVKLPNDIAYDFVDRWHLQGANKNTMKINYGLYSTEGKFKNLIAVMSLGIPRLKRQEGKEYELHRYCVADNYTVIGGAEKLLHQFEVEYVPDKIISYSDNDYFLGDIYKRLGFDYIGQSTPRYYWYKNGVELKREQCQLKYLKEKYVDLFNEAIELQAKNKEDYIMTKLGFCKVYRSGTTKWERVYR